MIKVYRALADRDIIPCQPFCIAAVGGLMSVTEQGIGLEFQQKETNNTIIGFVF